MKNKMLVFIIETARKKRSRKSLRPLVCCRRKRHAEVKQLYLRMRTTLKGAEQSSHESRVDPVNHSSRQDTCTVPIEPQKKIKMLMVNDAVVYILLFWGFNKIHSLSLSKVLFSESQVTFIPSNSLIFYRKVLKSTRTIKQLLNAISWTKVLFLTWFHLVVLLTIVIFIA